MPEEYFVECVCGERVAAKLFEAGTTKACQKCLSNVRIPSSLKLQESAGERFPFLSPIQQLRQAVDLQSAPFDGSCQSCSNKNASVCVPVVLSIMDERHVSSDDVIRPTVLGGAKFVVPAAVEHWARLRFPLNLCDRCHSQFHRERLRFKYLKHAMRCSMGVLTVATVYFAWNSREDLAWASGMLWLVGTLVWAFRSTNTKKIDSFALKWLMRIRWVSEIVSGEDEFRVWIGPPMAIGTPRIEMGGWH